jgi:hypothetical protein
MITINNLGYAGRLGNQMFQYATLMSLAKKTGFKPGIPQQNTNIKTHGTYDVTNNKWIEYRFLLNKYFNLNISLISDDKLKQLNYFYQEQYFHYDERLFDIKDNTSIEGYFQSYKYFEEIQNEIKKEFLFKEEIFNVSYEKINSLINHENDYDELVAIHIRRGDYIGLSGFEKLGVEYYQTAINKFCNVNYKFVIFSDDIDWCKSVFGEDESIYYSESQPEYVDMCMMSMCDHFIIANSSFSWWAAYLGQNKNKRVIAPLLWFNPNVGHNTKDLCPMEWELI